MASSTFYVEATSSRKKARNRAIAVMTATKMLKILVTLSKLFVTEYVSNSILVWSLKKFLMPF